MYYILVIDKGVRKVVTDSRGRIREFPKHRKAMNFIDGRPYLGDDLQAVPVSDVSSSCGTFKVDY